MYQKSLQASPEGTLFTERILDYDIKKYRGTNQNRKVLINRKYLY